MWKAKVGQMALMQELVTTSGPHEGAMKDRWSSCTRDKGKARVRRPII